MDPDGALTTKRQPRVDDITRDFLIRMSDRFPMAVDWRLELARVQRFLRDERKRYKIVGGEVGGSPQSSTSDGGGGLKDYALHFETSHKSFGTFLNKDATQWQDKDIEMADTRLPHDEGSEERSETVSILPLKVEKGDMSTDMSAQSTPVSRGFTAVNTQPNPVDDIRAHSSRPVSAYEPQTPNQASNADSPFPPQNRTFASPSNPYQSNVGSYPQYPLPMPPGTQTHNGLGHVAGNVLVPEDPGLSNWPPTGLPMTEAKLQMEMYGAQGIHNDAAFGGLVLRDGTPLDNTFYYPMDMPYAGDMNTESNVNHHSYGPWPRSVYGINNYSHSS